MRYQWRTTKDIETHSKENHETWNTMEHQLSEIKLASVAENVDAVKRWREERHLRCTWDSWEFWRVRWDKFKKMPSTSWNLFNPPGPCALQVPFHAAADPMQNGGHRCAGAFVGARLYSAVQGLESAWSSSSFSSACTTKGASRRPGPHVARPREAMPMARLVVGLW